MRIIDMHEATAHFSRLINSVIHGNEVIIGIAGKPVAKLAPINRRSKRKFGVLKGKIRIAKEFDAPLSDECLADFEG